MHITYAGIMPNIDSDLDLGTADLQFKDVYANQYHALTGDGVSDSGPGVPVDMDVIGGIITSITKQEGVDNSAAGVMMDAVLVEGIVTSQTKRDWLDQSVKAAASPGFAGLSVDTDTISVDKMNHRVGFETATPTAVVDINSDIMRLRTAKTPATAGSPGNPGDICWDGTYIYVCIADATWRRILHATW